MRVLALIFAMLLTPALPVEDPAANTRPLPDRTSFPDDDNYDKALRNAWKHDDLRDRAAAELHRLHRESGFKIRTDDQRIALLKRTLGPGFSVLKTPYFVIISDAPVAESRRRAQMLARARHQFYRFTDRIGYPAVPHRERLVCVFFDGYERYRAFGASSDGVEAPWAGGYYSRASNRIVLFNDRNSPSFRAAYQWITKAERKLLEIKDDARIAHRSGDRTRARQLDESAKTLREQIAQTEKSIKEQLDDVSTATVIHEAIHLLAFNSGLQNPGGAYPFWLTEGLAAAFETTHPSQAFGPDRPFEPREEKYRSLRAAGDTPSLEVLVALGDDEPLTADQAGMFYPSAYALFTTIAQAEPDALRGLLLSYVAETGPVDHAERFGRFLDPGLCGRRLAAK